MSYHSKLKQRLYARAPFFVKNSLASLYGYRQRRARFGKVFHTTLESLKKSQFTGSDQAKAEEQRNLSEFQEDAATHTRYYRDREAYGAGTESAFETLPILKKSSVQSHMKDFYRDGYEAGNFQWGHTSGTTGRAMVFPISGDCYQKEYAFRALHYGWGGVDFAGRERVAFCSGHPVAFEDRTRPPFWVHDCVNQWLLLSSYHLTQQNLPAYVRKLESFQPVMIGGYPSSLYLLALAVRKHRLRGIKLRSVFTASETLYDFQRVAIADAFGTPVFNWYGNSEFCGHITECDRGSLHIRHEHSYLEILDEQDRPCAPGETGRIVATGFANRLFPLIRYDVGDQVTLSKATECPCGRTGRLVDRIEGRQEDYIATMDGRLVGRLDHLFKDTVNVVEAQILQSEIERVVFRIVKRPEYGPNDEKEIVRMARLRLGSSVQIEFEYVDRIERAAGGKYRFIVSELNQEELLREWVES
jgi:phenylacetate-CoA ligase